MSDDDLNDIEAEFTRAGYALDLTESPKGEGWLSAYRPENQDQGTTDAHYGRTKLDAALAALAAFRQELKQRGE
jgi:hypothetical protein